jgi:hypothetical protein
MKGTVKKVLGYTLGNFVPQTNLITLVSGQDKQLLCRRLEAAWNIRKLSGLPEPGHQRRLLFGTTIFTYVEPILRLL